MNIITFKSSDIKITAIFFSREAIVLKLDQQVSGNIDVNNHVFLLVAATIYYNENSFETALKVLHQSDHLEW